MFIARNRLRAFIAAAAFALLASPAAGSAQQQPAGSLVLRPTEIMDARGFGQPVPALAVLAPPDWRVEGGATWNTSFCPSDIVTLHARIVSPDGAYGFEIFPVRTWLWYDDQTMVQRDAQKAAIGQGCTVAPARQAVDALRSIYLQQFRPGAQILGAEQDAVGLQALQAEIAQGMQIPGRRVMTDAVRLRLAYGPFEEWFGGRLQLVAYPAPSIGAAMGGQMANTTAYEMTASYVIAFRAPRGMLDHARPLYEAMLASVTVNPAWRLAAGRVLSDIKRGLRAAGIADAQAIKRAQDEIGEIHMRTWQFGQASRDRIAEARGHLLSGTQVFVNPSTGTQIQLPATHKYAWVNSQNYIVMSDDPTPPAQTQHWWTPLQQRGW